MGWVQAGEIEFYSISDIVGAFTILVFDIIKSLFQPHIFMVMILFVLSFLMYLYVAITRRIQNSVD